MRKIIYAFVLIGFSIVIYSFSMHPSDSPNEKVRAYYSSQFKELVNQLKQLQAGIRTNRPVAVLQNHFLLARKAYKKTELFVEYYYELDVAKINGPPIDFIEDEDPTAYQEPLGFQCIEPLLFPSYHRLSKTRLLNYLEKLISLTEGLNANSSSFEPGTYILDAVMEELYRITALGITGFDSPIAQLSLPEASAAVSSILQVLTIYQLEIPGPASVDYKKIIQLVNASEKYLIDNPRFDNFNRMEFITRFMNPACRLLGDLKSVNNFNNNPLRAGSIKKTSGLFDIENLRINPFLGDDRLTPEKIELGKKLFFDPSLSSTGTRSCAGCHQPGKGFTDGLPKAMQLSEHSSLPRNTPTLWNAALQKNLFHDSRKASLDELIIEVLGNENEMNSSAATAISKLNNKEDYKILLAKAYPGKETEFTPRIMVNSLSMYLYTLISYNSRFDKQIRGEKQTLTPQEVNGFNLFMGKARCATCHFAPLFNGSKPTLYFYQESEVIGVPATKDKKKPMLDTDTGRIMFTKKEFHRFAFKTPTIRNIAITGPYMHNGVFTTLEEVILFYNNGGGKGLNIAPTNQTLPFDKLNLSPKEIKNIIAFLRSLNDTSGTSFHRISY